MNRNDNSTKDRIKSSTNTRPINLASALMMFMQEKAQAKADVNHSGRKPLNGEQLREDAQNPRKKMEKRILGLKRYASSSSQFQSESPAKKTKKPVLGLEHRDVSPPRPTENSCYRTIHPNKMISLEKMENRVNGLKRRASSTPHCLAEDPCYRTIHPNKLIALEKMKTRVDGLKRHAGFPSSQKHQPEDMFHRTIHPNKMNIEETVAVGNCSDKKAKCKRIKQELFKQEDMIKVQAHALQKRYQLIHSDLGKLLRSTSARSPCSSASSSPTRVFSPSA